MGLDRRAAQRLGRHLVSAAPDATPRALQLGAEKRAACRAADRARAHASRRPGASRGRAQRWALGHRLRRQRHHGVARRLFGSAATRPRCPRFLRHAQTPEPVHHLPPAAQRQAAGNSAEAHDRAVGNIGARRKPLIFAATTNFRVVWDQNQSSTLRWRRRCIQRFDERRPKQEKHYSMPASNPILQKHSLPCHKE